MVRITRVHTGTGDDGTTGLVDGSRRSKGDIRLEAVGLCDEVNASFGMIRAATLDLNAQHDDGGPRSNVRRTGLVVLAALDRLQSEVFDLGAEVATPPGGLPEGMQVLGQEHADLLLEEMDEMLVELPPLTSFILPGGSHLLAAFHVARVTVRRLERTMVALREAETDGVRDLALVYVNRLSDWCFVMGRWCALRLGEDEVLWKPLGRRGPEDGIGGMLRLQRQHDDDVADV
ncbi:MAG TPA: ATP:cob(I)alamin adenosyltransferase [Candidatus Poseidoniaceae archaeon]|nr:MAG: ATP:cob(I)alamin adenosyltransferase [Euryarchaeota archaeon TMED141]DAC08767.1 MAG TPA: ATP:cob(I)alamin adenosyltransferase [Candidatus Poseidoniales archaeon]DAC18201.1 MAG TPA: ATP:cob(I)alamin adenosyltransferase [Candidatus Poseidoniales archaeon]HII19096.1 ATP:cob(I)alamin adenosyltransferase [Candidatus Poseidoniaceae archaeon]HII96521.1 ATP:cob(I)alamin adenosyltransferase [Candidatus Poseidoniaceae archaeon]|tara:strand:- start:857 stop:1552 length:696 start_codon:yes stop_codon:yes gene_type:complete